MIGVLSAQLTEIVLETLPVEFSILDAQDKVLAWNKHETRIFKRPKGVIGRDVRQCHPQKSLDKVERIIEEMKSGERDKARFWIEMMLESEETPQKILIEYYALRDDEGGYLGCLEVTQNITDHQNLAGEKRLLGEK
ncbi:MAG: PAS domain-containing protein [Anaerolineae bacterium]|nr:PAS domain-containing protein [Anaerolineae bacterium]